MQMSGNAAHKGNEEPGAWTASSLMREYIATARLAEIVYRDASGQVVTVHDTLRDLFCRAGRDFVLLGQGVMLAVDHVITLDGKAIAQPLQGSRE